MEKKSLLVTALSVFLLFTTLNVGSKPVSTKGVDDDGDGVPNTHDFCPATPFGSIVDPTGCPFDSEFNYDSDGDGVVDGVDQCINTPGTVPTGCP